MFARCGAYTRFKAVQSNAPEVLWLEYWPKDLNKWKYEKNISRKKNNVGCL
jgi:hypothetical protein